MRTAQSRNTFRGEEGDGREEEGEDRDGEKEGGRVVDAEGCSVVVLEREDVNVDVDIDEGADIVQLAVA